MPMIFDVCQNPSRTVIATPDINNDGFKDQIYQNKCDGKAYETWAALTNPLKPSQWLGLNQSCLGTWPCLENGLRKYVYRSDDYSQPKSDTGFAFDPIRVTNFSNMTATTFGLRDTVSYPRECTWNDIPQIASQHITGNLVSACTTTGEISEFTFMIDEAAGRVVTSGVFVTCPRAFIPLEQLTLVKSADPLRFEVRATAGKLLGTLTRDMGKSLQRHAEILQYAPRDKLYKTIQAELGTIEALVAGELKIRLNGPEFSAWSSEIHRYVFNMVINQLDFSPQNY